MHWGIWMDGAWRYCIWLSKGTAFTCYEITSNEYRYLIQDFSNLLICSPSTISELWIRFISWVMTTGPAFDGRTKGRVWDIVLAELVFAKCRKRNAVMERQAFNTPRERPQELK